MCSKVDLECAYGDAPNPYCDDLLQCQGRDPPFTWQKVPSPATCPQPGTPCPGSYAAAAAGMGLPCPLSPSAVGDLCAYPQGTCVCTNDPGGLPVAGGPVWACAPVTAGCVSPAPQVGSACTAPADQVCDYAGCSGGFDLQCTGGFWRLASVLCPK